MALKKIKDKILNSSDMYNFYKNEYEKDTKKINNMERMVQTHQDFLNHLFLFYDFKPTPFLTNMRKLSFEFLKFFDNICEKHNIEYWLDYGTLLGAVRHGGFIPWDDDLDVAMMRKDYNKFLEIFPQEIAENNLDNIDSYYKLARCNKKSQRWFQFSYRRPEYKDKFIGIDIFPHDYLKDYDGEDLEGKYTEFVKNYYKNPDTISLESFLNDFYTEFNLTFEKDDYIIPGCESLRGNHSLFTYPYAIIQTEEIFPLTKVKFGPYEFYAPNNSIDYLKGIYGNNFMRIPKTFKDHGRLNRFRKEIGVDEKVFEAYQIIKNVNENYK